MFPCDLPPGYAFLLADRQEMYIDHVTSQTSWDWNPALFAARLGVRPLHYEGASTQCPAFQLQSPAQEFQGILTPLVAR